MLAALVAAAVYFYVMRFIYTMHIYVYTVNGQAYNVIKQLNIRFNIIIIIIISDELTAWPASQT